MKTGRGGERWGREKPREKKERELSTHFDCRIGSEPSNPDIGK